MQRLAFNENFNLVSRIDAPIEATNKTTIG